MMNLLPGVQSSASALQAERIRLEVISQNIANANTTKTADGTPYKRQFVKFETFLQDKMSGGGDAVPQLLKAAQIIKDERPPNQVYEPGHPDADPDSGIVLYPNVNVHEEMADMIAASRAFEANLAVIKNARSMVLQTLAIGRR